MDNHSFELVKQSQGSKNIGNIWPYKTLQWVHNVMAKGVVPSCWNFILNIYTIYLV